jgi:UDP-N-acetylmuramoylalanine--D-glutamate ligase
VGEKNGIAFYNDSNSTTPEATMAALAALAAQKRPIILIAGGSDKELSFENLATMLPSTVKHLILFKGKATEKLQAFLPENFRPTIVTTMDEAFKAATTDARIGDIVLLSPGATSFGIFKNEYDRGDQFNELVRKLK